MILQPGNYVDNSGKCYLPYLSNWNKHPNENHSTLLGLCHELSRVFANQCPVYAKPVSTSTSTTPQLERPQPQHPHQLSSPSSQLQSLAPQSHSQFPIPALPPKPIEYSNPKSPPPLPPHPLDLHKNNVTSPSLQQVNVRSHQETTSIVQQIEQPSFMDDISSAKEDTKRKEVLCQISALLQKLYEVDVAHDLDTYNNIIDQIQYAIEQFDKIFDYEFHNIDAIKSQISENEQILKSTIQKAKNKIAEVHSHAELNPEEIIIAETVVHNQFYELVSEDLAISDTIAALAKAYELGKIPLQSFIKNTRSLSRDQFLKRALINKISALLKFE